MSEDYQDFVEAVYCVCLSQIKRDDKHINIEYLQDYMNYLMEGICKVEIISIDGEYNCQVKISSDVKVIKID